MDTERLNPGEDWIQNPQPSEILRQFGRGQLLMVDSHRRNGLILIKQFHAEFAGPGAAVGGSFDRDCQHVIPVEDLCLVVPQSLEERQKAYGIRRHWIRLTEQITANPIPSQRAQVILTQFEQYFNTSTVAQLPDEALAWLVGVLPPTLRKVRETQ